MKNLIDLVLLLIGIQCFLVSREAQNPLIAFILGFLAGMFMMGFIIRIDGDEGK